MISHETVERFDNGFFSRKYCWDLESIKKEKSVCSGYLLQKVQRKTEASSGFWRFQSSQQDIENMNHEYYEAWLVEDGEIILPNKHLDYHDRWLYTSKTGAWESMLFDYKEKYKTDGTVTMVGDVYWCKAESDVAQYIKASFKPGIVKWAGDLLSSYAFPNEINLCHVFHHAFEASWDFQNDNTFGTYPQTSDGNDQTAIEWIVLNYDSYNHRVLLLSLYGLEARPYKTGNDLVVWENSALRSWLNSSFLKQAFSTEEQSAILTTKIDNSSSQGLYIYRRGDGGDDTQDKVFLLSYAEAKRYLDAVFDGDPHPYGGVKKSRVIPTAYAISQGAWESKSEKTESDMPAGYWWLRSPGGSRNMVAYVQANGCVRDRQSDSKGILVRPAIWLNLESDIF